jgi:hypothetical protein
MNVKSCKDCKNELPLEEFYVSYISSKGEKIHKSSCKHCHKIYSKNWIKEHPKQKQKIQKKYNSKNIEKIKEYSKNYDSREIQKTFYNKNKHKFFEYKKKRRKENLNFKIKENTRKRIYDYIKNKNLAKKVEYLGCTIGEYILYLEKQFDENMTWENYGTYWEIDHVIQLFNFDFNIESNIFKAFNFNNTRPLSIVENRSRSKKYKT